MPLKPVVFVPGYPASELKQRSRNRTIFPPAISDVTDGDRRREILRLLRGPDDPPGDIVAGEPVRSALGLTKQAQSLYDVLRSFGYTTQDGSLLAPVGWDWRLGVDHPLVQDALADAIEGLERRHRRPVVVIIHSTGGLVLRALLEARPQLAGKIEQILAFGIPWAGTLKAVRAVAEGEALGLFLFGRRIVGLTAAEVREVTRRCQAAYDLFPPDPAKTALQGTDNRNLNLFVRGNRGGQVGPLVATTWIPAGPATDFMRALAAEADRRLGTRPSTLALPGVPTPPVTNVVGWGIATDTRCTLDSAGALEFQATKEGDGTVAAASAAWLRGPGVRTFFLPIGLTAEAFIPEPHPRIWNAMPVLQLFNQVLFDVEPQPFVCGSIDSDDGIEGSGPFTVRLSASAADGQPLPDVRATFTSLPGRRAVPFAAGAVRKEVLVERDGLTATEPQNRRRFRVDVSWGNRGPDETRQVPFLVRV